MTTKDKKPLSVLAGRGGGGKKGASANPSAPNTLRSAARARMVFALSEGVIEGIPGGLKNVYRDQTPIQNEDGTFNFENVLFEEHKGLPDDTHFQGHDDVGVLQEVSAPVTQAAGPVVRQIIEPEADAVSVIIRLEALFKADKSSGSLQAHSVEYAVDRRVAGGQWEEVVRQPITAQKTMSPVQFSHRIPLPVGGAPWAVRVRRISPDETSDDYSSNITFDSLVIRTEGRFTYPHTAAFALEINAEDIGGSIGAISTKKRGRVIQVPSNYDPVNRTYTGIWDGTFKDAYSNNPAWVYWDLVENDRYGCGDMVDPTLHDKWTLYTIGQYCDGEVPSGYKDENGNDILEPRYTFNGKISGRDEALNVLRGITGVFRGMAYWSLGYMTATADMPSDPIALVSAANVKNGAFTYSTTAAKARHSVILVRWNDPEDFFRPAVQPVISDSLVQRYGWRSKTITLPGCTSRSLATRYGRWILDTTEHETETVTYTCTLDQLQALPGQIVSIFDPRKAQVRMAGRIVSQTSTTTTLDAEPDLPEGVSATISWIGQDGKVHSRPIQSISGSVLTHNSVASENRALPNGMFGISSTEVAPRQYRILTIREAGPAEFQVTALFHDPNKYARVERGMAFEPPSYSRNKGPVPAPTNLRVIEVATANGGTLRSRLEASWAAPLGFVGLQFEARVTSPTRGVITLPLTTSPNIEFDTTEIGDHLVEVRARDILGRVSEAVSLIYTVRGVEGFSAGEVDALQLSNGGAVFTGTEAQISWVNKMPESSAIGAETVAAENSPVYSHNLVSVFRADTGEKLRDAVVIGNSYGYKLTDNIADNAALGRGAARNLRFEVKVFNVSGQGSTASVVTVSNPAPAAIAPVVKSQGTQITVTLPSTGEEDEAGFRIWIEKNNSFNPENTTPVYEGAGGTYVFDGEITETYWVRAAAYDRFGVSGLNVSPAFEIATGLPVVISTEPPAKPTALSLASALTEDGKVARVTASWNAVSSPNLSHYDLQLAENGGNLIGFTTSSTNHEISVLPGTIITGRVRSVDRLGNTSTWAVFTSHTAAKDTVPPDEVSGLSITAGFGAIWLDWNPNTEQDLSHYEVLMRNTNSAPGASTTPTTTTTSTTFARTGLENEVTRYFWVRAVDTSGNKSGWSNVKSATTLATEAVTTEDIQGIVDATSFASNVKPVEIVSSLPGTPHVEGRVVYHSGQNKLYRNTGSGWTAAVETTDLSGQISTSQIQNGAISLDKFVSGLRPIESVSALPSNGNTEGRVVLLSSDGKLYRYTGGSWVTSVSASDITGQIQSNQLAAVAASKITGQLTDAQIAAVDAAKLSGTIAEARLASLNASKLTGTIAEARLASLSASKITGKLTDAQIDALSAAKLTGQVVSAQIEDAALTAAKFASNVKPVEVVSALPGTPHVQGRVVLLTSDNKLYRNTGSGWTAATPAADISGQIQAAQIQALEAAKITGQIGNNQIDTVATTKLTGTITNAQIAELNAAKIAGQLASSQIANLDAAKLTGTINEARINALAASKLTGQITETQISNNAISTPKIAAGAITSAKITAGAVTTNLLAAGAVTAGKIETNAVTADKIAASAITSEKISAGAVLATSLAAGSVTTSKLSIGDTSNIYPDPDFLDQSVYSGVPFSIMPTTEAKAGTSKNFLTISAAHAGEVLSPAFQVEDGKPYFLSATMETAGSGSGAARVYIRWYSDFDATTEIQTDFVGGHSGTIWTLRSGTFTAPANTRRARFIFTQEENAQKSARFSEPIVRRAANGELIVDGSITTGKISAGAVTADEIASNAITSAKIQAGAVTTNELAAGAVTTAKITAGAITANEISSGAITTAKIQAGAITADEIASNAITAGKIAADAVTAGTIAAGAITGTEIAADTITASKLVVSDATNLYPDFDMLDNAFYASSTGHSIVFNGTTNQNLGRRYINTSSGGNALSIETQWSSCDTAGPVIVSGAVWEGNPNGGTVKLEIEFGTVHSNGSVTPTRRVLVGERTNVSSATPFVIYEEVAAAEQRFRFIASHNGVGGSVLRSGGWSLRRRMNAEMIVDGSITTDKLVANAITTDKIAANAVTADEIASNSITTDKIAANAVTADEIASNSITTAKIEAGAITTAKITAGAITANEIAANAVTTAKIQAGAITADELASNSVTAAKITAGAVSTSELAAGAVVADKIASNAVTTAKLQAGAVTTAKITAGAITTSELAAGAVTTAKIKAGAVTTDELAANAVTANKIQAGAISADKIAANAITTEKLAIGTGVNLLSNTDFLSGDLGWFVVKNGSDSIGSGLRSAGDSWAGDDYPTFFLFQDGTDTGTYGDLRFQRIVNTSGATSMGVPVVAGKTYEVSAYISTHRCNAELRVQWLDVDGSTLSYSPATTMGPAQGSGNNPNVWTRLVARDVAPGAAVYATIHIRKRGTQSGSNSWMFVHRPLLGETVAGATEALPYSSGGFTLLDGNSIISDTIDARHIRTNAVTADKIAANAVTAGKIAANAVTADKIAANTITSGQIAAGAIGAEEIAAGVITAQHVGIGDFENYGGGNNFESAWSLPPNWSIEEPGGSIDRALVAPANGGNAYSPTIMTVVPGEEIYIGFWAQKSSDWDGTGGGSKLRVGGPGGNPYIQALEYGSSDVTTSWAYYEKIFTVPNGVSQLHLALWNNGSTGWVKLSNIQIFRRKSGKLIVDGAIKSNHLVTNEAVVTGTAQIADAIITDAKIANLNAAKLQAGTALTGSLTVNGAALGTIGSSAVSGGSVFTFQDDVFSSWVTASGHTVTQSADALSEKSGLITCSAGSNPSSAGSTNVVRMVIPTEVSSSRSGKRVRISVIAKKPSSNAADEFAVAFSTNSVGNSGWQYFTPTTSWQVFTFYYDIAPNNMNENYVGIWGDTSRSGKGVLVQSVTIDTSTEDYATDPAARINTQATQIDPGKILVSGSTTLQDWRLGADQTKIDGGAIGVNTIAANKLEIGARGVTLTGIEFEHNKPGTNQVSWSNGAVRFTSDGGAETSANITGGSATWSSGVLYIYWIKGASTFSTTSSQSTARGADRIILATYQGGTLLDADYGRTIVDGGKIKTGTITATQIATGTLTADRVNTGSFATAGLAVFGNSLQSNGFTPGASGQGWEIKADGSATFGTLQLREGAVSTSALGDIWKSTTNQNTNGGTFTPLSLGIINGSAVTLWIMLRTTNQSNFAGMQLFIDWQTPAGTTTVATYTFPAGYTQANGSENIFIPGVLNQTDVKGVVGVAGTGTLSARFSPHDLHIHGSIQAFILETKR